MSNWIGIAEACEILGVSPNTVKKLVRKGILPAYQIAGVRGLQFHPEDVEKLVQRVEPDAAKDLPPSRAQSKRTSTSQRPR